MTDHRYDYAVGIDPGTATGVALALPETEARGYRWEQLQTLPLHRALAYVEDIVRRLESERGCARVLVVVEDARQISGPALKKLGAGSIRRDCKVWEELLADLGAELDGLRTIFVKPTNRTLRKLDAEQLATYTGCQLKGSQHARDAAGVLFPYL